MSQPQTDFSQVDRSNALYERPPVTIADEPTFRTVKSAIESLTEIEAIAEKLPDGDPLRQALSFRPVIGSYTTRFSNVVSAEKLIGFNENDGLQGKLRTAVHSV